MSSRLGGLVALAIIGLHAALVLPLDHDATLHGRPFEVFGLGGGPYHGSALAAAVTLALALLLGWGIPGLALAHLSARLCPARCWPARALPLGVGYILVTGVVYTVVFGHAPSRAVLLILIAVPPLVVAVRPPHEPMALRPVAVAVAVLVMGLLAMLFWGKLRHEGMNGDGTEAYELARSLDDHALPRWDLERWEPPGRFGVPTVNPFLTNSYLVHAVMTIAGRGELAARLPLISGLVLAGWLAGSLQGRLRFDARLYVGAVLALYALWNSYAVGYEPAFTDLAEPAATDTLMIALWLAGFVEVAIGTVGFGILAFVLSAGILYSAPLLATIALTAFALTRPGAPRRAWVAWLVAMACATVAALAVGVATGDLADWMRQLRSEYWNDFTDVTRRTPGLPFALKTLLLTGGLPLVALGRWRRLSPPARALLLTAIVYLIVFFCGSYKNLHYLAPVPFLLAAPALEAATPALTRLATAVVVCGFALSWPSPLTIHRETIDLGRISCVEDLDYESACLTGDVVYQAFPRTGTDAAFRVGKHTFVRYAIDLGGRSCEFRLSRATPRGWTRVSGTDVALSVRDLDVYRRWRDFRPPVPRSLLFPEPLR